MTLSFHSGVSGVFCGKNCSMEILSFYSFPKSYGETGVAGFTCPNSIRARSFNGEAITFRTLAGIFQRLRCRALVDITSGITSTPVFSLAVNF